MAGRSQSILKPFRGLGKLMLGVSAKAWALIVSVAADTRGTLTIVRSGIGREDDDRERAGAGPDDMPTNRETRDSPIHLGA
jgi:hypothetical protein